MLNDPTNDNEQLISLKNANDEIFNYNSNKKSLLLITFSCLNVYVTKEHHSTKNNASIPLERSAQQPPQLTDKGPTSILIITATRLFAFVCIERKESYLRQSGEWAARVAGSARAGIGCERQEFPRGVFTTPSHSTFGTAHRFA